MSKSSSCPVPIIVWTHSSNFKLIIYMQSAPCSKKFILMSLFTHVIRIPILQSVRTEDWKLHIHNMNKPCTKVPTSKYLLKLPWQFEGRYRWTRNNSYEIFLMTWWFFAYWTQNCRNLIIRTFRSMWHRNLVLQRHIIKVSYYDVTFLIKSFHNHVW